ncbi:MAG: VOC family protein [Kiloniellales bacterium]
MPGHGSFHWNELMTRDVEKAKGFYGDCLGWTFEGMPMPDGTYWIIHAGDAFVGGMMEMTKERGIPDDAPTSWMSYIEVDDIDARLEKVAAAGGQIMRPAFDVPGVGRIAMICDPTGAMIGWITPAQPQG